MANLAQTISYMNKKLCLYIKWSRLVKHLKTGHVRFSDLHVFLYQSFPWPRCGRFFLWWSLVRRHIFQPPCWSLFQSSLLNYLLQFIKGIYSPPTSMSMDYHDRNINHISERSVNSNLNNYKLLPPLLVFEPRSTTDFEAIAIPMCHRAS